MVAKDLRADATPAYIEWVNGYHVGRLLIVIAGSYRVAGPPHVMHQMVGWTFPVLLVMWQAAARLSEGLSKVFPARVKRN